MNGEIPLLSLVAPAHVIPGACEAGLCAEARDHSRRTCGPSGESAKRIYKIGTRTERLQLWRKIQQKTADGASSSDFTRSASFSWPGNALGGLNKSINVKSLDTAGWSQQRGRNPTLTTPDQPR